VDDLKGEIGPDHEESTVGKIENAQQAKDEAEARGQQKKAGGEGEAVQKEVNIDVRFQKDLYLF
jgi:hypothetical protein